MPLTRFLPALAALLLVSCSGGETEAPRVPCASQLECAGGREFTAACASGYCSTKFDSGYLANLTLGVRNTQLKLQGIKSFRVWSIYPVRPDGTDVKCPKPGSREELSDPVKTNQGAAVAEKNFSPGSNDTIIFAVRLTGPGRVVYVEVYRNELDLTAPGSEGAPIGSGCVENADYSGSESSPSSVLMEIQPVTG